jgi:PTH1 family peptidyl-tRNA hydrolase
MEGPLKLIVGLGNPGPRYSHNRHNVGYQCIERLVRMYDMPAPRIMFKAYVTSGIVEGERTVLARPLTFMNLSGLAVRPLLLWYHLALSDLLVVHDDLDLPLGKLRLRSGGSSGGHKGLQSIIETLGSQTVARLRIGIGRPVHGEPPDYVLSDFTPDELITMEASYDRAVAAIVSFTTLGITAAMNQVNSSTPGQDFDSAPGADGAQS